MSGGSEIFVVDDDVAVRDSLSTLLQIEGYGVAVFSDGHGFLAAAKQRTPAA